MNTSGLIIRQLIFTGSHVEPAQLHFDSGLNLLYGASNTGKSFSLKAIDFMLGGSDLPDIPERIGYDKIWFGFSLKGVGDFTLSRSTEGGDYELYNGFIDFNNPTNKIQILAPTQQTKSTKSLPHYLLEQLGFSGRKLAKNADGVTNSISFRDLAVISLVDETSIQSERSPIETGQRMSRSKERSLFRMLLTGQDDSSITPVVDLKTFNTSKAVRIEVIEDMLRVIESKLSEYPNVADLPSQSEKLLASLAKIQSEFEAAQGN